MVFPSRPAYIDRMDMSPMPGCRRAIAMAAAAACVAAGALAAAPAAADNYVVIPSPTVGGAAPPYGPGFNQGVVVGPRDGCRTVVSCAGGNYVNRPAHRRYYDNYFDVPAPRYSGQRPLGGTPAVGGASRLGGASDHHGWCASRYRSYRASDDTFQPFDGPRTRCISPY